MAFLTNVCKIQDILQDMGFDIRNEIAEIRAKPTNVDLVDCSLISKNDGFEIFYLETLNNQKNCGKLMVQSNITPCMVITGHRDGYLITVADFNTTNNNVKYFKINKVMLKEILKLIIENDGSRWEKNEKLVGFLELAKSMKLN